MNQHATPPRSVEPEHASPPAGLLRALGLWTGIALVVGQVIGTGIFMKPGAIAQELGDFRLIVLAWLLGGVLCLLGALCIAELAAMLPTAGGLYVYLREAYSPLAGFLFGWNDLLFNRPAASGALAVAFAGSLFRAWGAPAGALVEAALAVALVVVLAWINIRGVRLGGGVQVATTAIKVAFVVLVALLPLALLLVGWSNFTPANWSSRAPVTSDGSLLARFGVVMLAVMWAYNGWHGITPMAEEIRQPERNIPRALIAGIGLLMLLYLAANLAYHGTLSMSQVSASGEHTAQEMMTQLLGRAGDAALAAVIMVSTLGAINGDLLLGPRISFAMGRDRVFFASLGRVHARYRTPAVAITVQAGMSIVLVLVTALLVEFNPRFSQNSVFELLTNFVIFAASIFYALGVLAVPVLRWRRPHLPRPYRAWGYPLVPAVFLVVYGWFLCEVYASRPFEAQSGLLLIALGLPVYFGFVLSRRPRAAA